jgi:hypothetical protein
VLQRTRSDGQAFKSAQSAVVVFRNSWRVLSLFSALEDKSTFKPARKRRAGQMSNLEKKE